MPRILGLLANYHEVHLSPSSSPENRPTSRALGDFYSEIVSKLVAGETLSVTVFGDAEQDLKARVIGVLGSYNSALAESNPGLIAALSGEAIDERDDQCVARTVFVRALRISNDGSCLEDSTIPETANLQPSGMETAQLTELAWYRAILPAGHMGAGKARDMVVYIHAPDTLAALEILGGVGGWKRRQCPYILDKMAEDATKLLLTTLSKSPPKSAEDWLARGFIKEDELSHPLIRTTGHSRQRQSDS